MRDFLGFHIEKGNPVNKRLLGEWIDYHSKAMVFNPDFIEDEKLAKKIKEYLKNSHARDIKDNFLDTYYNILASAKDGNYQIDPIDFFTNLNRNISLYRNIASNVINKQMEEELVNYMSKYLILIALFGVLLLLSIILILFSSKISRELEQNSKELEESLKRAVSELEKTDPSVKEELQSI